MMDRQDHFFTPDQVDEQIEQCSDSCSNTPEARLLAEMQQVAEQLYVEQERSLQRTWIRLQERSQLAASPFPYQKREQHMQQPESASLGKRYQWIERQVPHKINRAFSAILVAAVVMLTVLAWTVLAPALRSQGSLVGGQKAPQSSNMLNAKQVCSFTDTIPYVANSLTYDSASWSKTGNIALTHRDSVVVNGTNCVRNNAYHNTMSIPQGAVWSPDGKTLLAFTISTVNGLTQSDLQIVNSNGQLLKTIVLQPASGPLGRISSSQSNLMSSQVNLSQTKSSIWGPTWSPDGSNFSAIFTTSDDISYLKTWKTQDLGQVLNRKLNLFGEDIINVAWSPDGRYVAAATFGPTVGVLVFDAHTGSLHTTIHTGEATNLDWSPNSQELVTSNSSNQVIIWQMATGRQVHQFTGATSAITSPITASDLQVAWSPDGKEIAASGKHTVVWDVSSGNIIANINSDDAQLAWAPDSQTLATFSIMSSTKAMLTVWRL